MTNTTETANTKKHVQSGSFNYYWAAMGGQLVESVTDTGEALALIHVDADGVGSAEARKVVPQVIAFKRDYKPGKAISKNAYFFRAQIGAEVVAGFVDDNIRGPDADNVRDYAKAAIADSECKVGCLFRTVNPDSPVRALIIDAVRYMIVNRDKYPMAYRTAKPKVGKALIESQATQLETQATELETQATELDGLKAQLEVFKAQVAELAAKSA